MSRAPRVDGRVLKEDALGRVVRIELPSSDDGASPRFAVCRIACGGRIPGSAWVARRLLARERKALRRLEGLHGVPQLVDERDIGIDARRALVRTWIDGVGLHETETLASDFFDHLDALVLALHARGVCHNDLHKEQNVLVDPRGLPWLVDFQLASVHVPGSRAHAARAREDLRHVEKHRRRYARAGRPREAVDLTEVRGRGHGLRRSWLAWIWRRAAKPIYVGLTRGVLRTKDGEARRATSGPWPRSTEPLGRIERGGVT